MENLPKTLIEAVRYYSDLDFCESLLAKTRWPDGPACISCGSFHVKKLATRKIYKCYDCKRQFSVKVGTIFEDSPIPLSKWFVCFWLIANCKNGISSYEIHRDLGVTQKTAWFMLQRCREVFMTDTSKKLNGTVEADETFIGGKDKNRHANKKKHIQHGHGDTTIVLGMVERGGRVTAKVVDSVKARDLKPAIRENIEQGSVLYTDELQSYKGLQKEYYRDMVNHSEGQYVKGNTHTNTIENFWSLVKRALKGTYIHVTPKHLDRYLDEQEFRYDHRKTDDPHRFLGSLERVEGKRLTYERLIGHAKTKTTHAAQAQS
ncbi:MAG: IS1595 family transposase [Candidatus Kapaibacterium sp.]